MGSLQPPKHAYSPEDLNQLEWLFDSVWTMYKAQHPTRDEVLDAELKTSLRQTLFTLAARRELGNEDELCARLLASVTVGETLGRSVRSRRPRKLKAVP